jgi:hypothetical protein
VEPFANERTHRIEQVLPGTGHMFRFSHPTLYSKYIKEFLKTQQCLDHSEVLVEDSRKFVNNL